MQTQTYPAHWKNAQAYIMQIKFSWYFANSNLYIYVSVLFLQSIFSA